MFRLLAGIGSFVAASLVGSPPSSAKEEHDEAEGEGEGEEETTGGEARRKVR